MQSYYRRVARHIYFAVTVSIFIGLLWLWASPREKGPQLHFDESVASDLRSLADETWSLFLTTFAARTTCFGDVHLRTDPNLTSRAAYEPERSTVIVKVPATPAYLQGALVHEWAHHVEFQCDAHQAIRPALLASLRLSPDTLWRVGHAWEESPSEHYAEAAIVLVLGERSLPTKIRVDGDMVAILAEWAKGE